MLKRKRGRQHSIVQDAHPADFPVRAWLPCRAALRKQMGDGRFSLPKIRQHTHAQPPLIPSTTPLPPPTPPPHPIQQKQCRRWQQAEVRAGHFLLRKWVPDRPQPTAELQAAPRVAHGSQRRGAAAALLAAGMCVVAWAVNLPYPPGWELVDRPSGWLTG
jgi:hypothetical protein